MSNLAAKLAYLAGTKTAIRGAIQSKGIAVPDDTPFRQYANLIGGISGGENADVSNVVNHPWYNPGTMLGGIYWTDPAVEFESIEIIDTSAGSEVVAEVAPGVQFWEPEEGAHAYLIRAKLSGGVSIGVQLPETTYTIVYIANLLSVTVPMHSDNSIVLSFDNFVSIEDASGFSISGIDDVLEFVDQPDVKTIRLKLATKHFAQSGSYTISYDPGAGNVLTNDGEAIAAIIGHTIENYADYTPANFISAQIPQAEPSTLVVVMSRPVHVEDATEFELSGTDAQITGVISDGTTIEFSLSEPVDHSDVESDIKLSFSGIGVTDDAGQEVFEFSNRPVSNNSTNQAITIQNAEVPASDAYSLVVVMQGAVTMSDASGFSLSSIDQVNLSDIGECDFDVSDGTISFTLDKPIIAGKTITLNYNGAGTLKAANNDTIKAFSVAITNNSTYNGIPSGTQARNLAVVVLGREAEAPEDITEIFNAIHQTIEMGNVANFVLGDYFNLPVSAQHPFTVAAGYDSGGAINLATNADLGANGRHISFMVVSKNGLKGKNGNDYDHVVFHSKNVLGYSGETNADGHYMEASRINTNGYLGCKMRQYLLNNMMPALAALGIPFSSEYTKAPARLISKGGSAGNPGVDTVSDKIFLPTEYEMFGNHTYSNSAAEAAANQGRLEYYDDNAKRTKYNRDNAARLYWEASPRSGNTYNFCTVNSDGSANDYGSNTAFGLAPAFCVA